MLSRNRAPRVCREPNSSKPAVLGRARFASCTGQIHETACSTAHARLHNRVFWGLLWVRYMIADCQRHTARLPYWRGSNQSKLFWRCAAHAQRHRRSNSSALCYCETPTSLAFVWFSQDSRRQRAVSPRPTTVVTYMVRRWPRESPPIWQGVGLHSHHLYGKALASIVTTYMVRLWPL